MTVGIESRVADIVRQTPPQVQDILARISEDLPGFDNIDGFSQLDTVDISQEALDSFQGRAFLQQQFSAVAKITASVETTETLSVSLSDEGIEVQSPLEQVKTISAEIQFNQQQTLGLFGSGGLPDPDTELADFLKAFEGVLQEFGDTLDQLFKRSPSVGVFA